MKNESVLIIALATNQLTRGIGWVPRVAAVPLPVVVDAKLARRLQRSGSRFQSAVCAACSPHSQTRSAQQWLKNSFQLN